MLICDNQNFTLKLLQNANSNIISVFYTKAKMRIGITYEEFTQ